MRSDIIRNMVLISVGIMLVFMNESTMPLLVRIVGVLFFVPAFISLANLIFSRPGVDGAGMAFIILLNVGSMAFGLWLLLSPAAFGDIFLKLLAIVLLALSLYRIYRLFRERKSPAVSWKMCVVPLLAAIASVVLFVNPFATVSTLSVMLGSCAIVAGISDIFLLFYLENGKRNLQSREEDV